MLLNIGKKLFKVVCSKNYVWESFWNLSLFHIELIFVDVRFSNILSKIWLFIF